MRILTQEQFNSQRFSTAWRALHAPHSGGQLTCSGWSGVIDDAVAVMYIYVSVIYI
jgi:hypothetical protein